MNNETISAVANCSARKLNKKQSRASVSYGGRSDGSSTAPDVQDGTVLWTFGDVAKAAEGATAGDAPGAGIVAGWS